MARSNFPDMIDLNIFYYSSYQMDWVTCTAYTIHEHIHTYINNAHLIQSYRQYDSKRIQVKSLASLHCVRENQHLIESKWGY